MTYQNEYNTKLSQSLLQIFMFAVDNPQITFEDYHEITGLDRVSFSRTMTQFKQMLESLNMKMNISSGTIPGELNQFEPKLYVINHLDEPYDLEYENVDSNELITYSLVIVYCFLKLKKYVTLKSLTRIFPDFTKQKFSKLLSKLKEVISEDVYKNELKSYILEDVE